MIDAFVDALGDSTTFTLQDLHYCFNHSIGRMVGVGNKVLGIDVGPAKDALDARELPAIIITDDDGTVVSGGPDGAEHPSAPSVLDSEADLPVGSSPVATSCLKVGASRTSSRAHELA